MPTDVRFVRGLYTKADTARFAGLRPSAVYAWTRAEGTDRPPVTAVAPAPVGRRVVPFVGLVEAAVLQAFISAGLSAGGIRRMLGALDAQGARRHVLASRRLGDDGPGIVCDHAQAHDDPELLGLIAENGPRKAFRSDIAARFGLIEFAGDWPSSMILPSTRRRLLRVSPEVASGQPLFLRGGAPLTAVRDRMLAGEPVQSVAEDYEVLVEDIEEACADIWPDTGTGR